MTQRLLLKLIKIWWEGFKIFCGYSAFGIILFILCLPEMALIKLVGESAGYIIGSVLAVFIVPVIFFLTFKYLLLWGDKEQHQVESDENSTGVAERRNRETERAILLRKALTLSIVLFVFSIVAAIITPPDVVTQVFVIAQMVIIYGLLIFIISKFKSFVQTPETIKNLIVVLVCLLSITIPCSVTFFQYYHRLKTERSEQITSAVSSETANSESLNNISSSVHTANKIGNEK